MSFIDLPFDGRRQSYDRDKLATAYLILLEVLDGREEPLIADSKAVAARLRSEHGFLDSASYAVGARIAFENGVEP